MRARARFLAAGDEFTLTDRAGLLLEEETLSGAREERLLGGRERRWDSRASWSFQATALRRRMRLASLTRRRKSGSVVRVRKVSLRILE